jgi:hypothetical protein
MSWAAFSPDLTTTWPSSRDSLGSGAGMTKTWTIVNGYTGVGYSSTKIHYFYLGVFGSASVSDANGQTTFPSLPYVVSGSYTNLQKIGPFTFDNGVDVP